MYEIENDNICTDVDLTCYQYDLVCDKKSALKNWERYVTKLNIFYDVLIFEMYVWQKSV